MNERRYPRLALDPRIPFHFEEGWVGAFTRTHDPGAAFAPGARVRKAVEDPGDPTPLGSTATVLGSIGNEHIGYASFVEWDHKPRHAVLVMQWKLAPAIEP